MSVDKGYTTLLKDMNHAGLSRGIQQVQGGVDKAVKWKKITKFVGDQYMFNLEPTLNYAGGESEKPSQGGVRGFRQVRLKYYGPFACK